MPSTSDHTHWSLRRVRIRRTSISLNGPSVTDSRLKQRRLFGRLSPTNSTATTNTPINIDDHQPPQQEQEQDTGRRSFLAKPPAPGATRRVLTVLNQPGRPRRTATEQQPRQPIVQPQQKQQSAALSAVSASGYDEPEREKHHHRRRKVDKKNSNSNSSTANSLPPARLSSPVHDKHDQHIGAASMCDVDIAVDVDVDVEVETVDEVASEQVDNEQHAQRQVAHSQHQEQSKDRINHQKDASVNHADREVKHVSEETIESVNRVDSVGSSMPSSRALGILQSASSPRLIEVEASEISDDIHSSGDPRSSSRQHHIMNEGVSSSFITATNTTSASITSTNETVSKRAKTLDDDDNNNPGSKNEQGQEPQVVDEEVEEEFFDTVPVIGVAFDTVGADESDVPDAPTNDICNPNSPSTGNDDDTPISINANALAQQNMWDNLQQRIGSLQKAITSADDEKRTLRRRIETLAQRRKDDQVLMESLRLRTTEANTEVEQLTRQLKDTRKQMSRRVRDLEEQMELKDNQHAEELHSRKQIEKRLRHELELALNSNKSSRKSKNRGNNFAQSSSSAAILQQQQLPVPNFSINPTLSDSTKNAKNISNTSSNNIPTTLSSSASSIPVAAIGHVEASARAAAAVGRPNSVTSSEPGRMRKGRSDIPAPPVRPGTPGASSTRSKTCSSRPTTPGRKMMSLTAPSSISNYSTSSYHHSSNSNYNNSGGDDMSLGTIMDSNSQNCNISQKTLARRSLIRRAFIAHIQSPRYRSARMVWFEFFGADDNHISYDLFTRAVRSLAVAADARDKDLELLVHELCTSSDSSIHSERDTSIISWVMFAKFYQKTKTLTET